MNAVFSVVEKYLAGGQPYLAGQFSIADICMGAQLHRYFSLDFTRPKLDLLLAYYERLKTNKAYQTLILNEKFV